MTVKIKSTKLNNGNKIPLVGFGTYNLQGENGINCIVNAIKEGYRYIDTAQSYNNEIYVGQAIEFCIKNNIVKREDLFVLTKLSPFICIGYNETKKAFYESLEKLKLDYVDAFLIHWPNVTKDEKWKILNAQTWQAMEELYAEGKIKNLGISNFEIHHIETLLKTAKIKPQINEIQLSPYWQQKHLVQFCKNQDIFCVGYQTIRSLFEHDTTTLKQLARIYNKSIFQIALKYHIQQGCGVLAMGDKLNYLRENKDVFDFNLKKEDIKELDELNSNPIDHRTADSIYGCFCMYEELSERKQKVTIKFKLFNLIPLIKIRCKYLSKIHYNFKCYLFNIIPFISGVKKDKMYIYLFGIKIGKLKIHTSYTKEKFIPRYENSNLKSRES